MRHPSDTICNATHNITSTIYFLCAEDAKVRIEYVKKKIIITIKKGFRFCIYMYSV